MKSQNSNGSVRNPISPRKGFLFFQWGRMTSRFWDYGAESVAGSVSGSGGRSIRSQTNNPFLTPNSSSAIPQVSQPMYSHNLDVARASLARALEASAAPSRSKHITPEKDLELADLRLIDHLEAQVGYGLAPPFLPFRGSKIKLAELATRKENWESSAANLANLVKQAARHFSTRKGQWPQSANLTS